MSNTISSWFIPFWYSAASGENTTLEMINKKREELKAKNEEPGFPKTLTRAKAVAGGVGILGILGAIFGFSKDNRSGKILGIGAAVLGVVGWFVDKVFVKSSDSTKQNNQVQDSKLTSENTQQDKEGTNEVTQKPKTEIENLVEQLSHYDNTSDLAKQRLLELGDSAIEPLLDLLRNNKVYDWQVIRIIDLFKTAKAMDTLIELSKCSCSRQTAIYSLCNYEDRKVTDVLAGYLNDENLYVRSACAAELARRKDLRVIEHTDSFIAGLHIPEESKCSIDALVAIGELKNDHGERATEALASFVDSNPDLGEDLRIKIYAHLASPKLLLELEKINNYDARRAIETICNKIKEQLASCDAKALKEELSQLGEPITKYLLQYLEPTFDELIRIDQGNSWLIHRNIRENVREILVNIRGSLDANLELFGNFDDSLCELAIKDVASLREGAENKLIELLEKNEINRTSFSALIALYEINTPRAKPHIERMELRAKTLVRTCIERALNRIEIAGTDKEIESLYEDALATETLDYRIRKAAVRELIRMGAEDVLKKVYSDTKESDIKQQIDERFHNSSL